MTDPNPNAGKPNETGSPNWYTHRHFSLGGLNGPKDAAGNELRYAVEIRDVHLGVELAVVQLGIPRRGEAYPFLIDGHAGHVARMSHDSALQVALALLERSKAPSPDACNVHRDCWEAEKAARAGGTPVAHCYVKGCDACARVTAGALAK